MSWMWALLVLGGVLPLFRAWRAARGSTIRHPLVWAIASWLAWSLTAWRGGDYLHWLALSLTACAGVAVLNARRPHAVAWHFVVAGLLLLLLRPFWEGMGRLRLEGLYVTALAVALAVTIGNHLPTRLGLPALILGGWCGIDLARLTGTVGVDWAWSWPVLAVLPWMGWLLVIRKPKSPFDARWVTFRDRFGFVWSALVREMFNNSARNSELPVALLWSGAEGEVDDRALVTLSAVLRRFEECDPES